MTVILLLALLRFMVGLLLLGLLLLGLLHLVLHIIYKQNLLIIVRPVLKYLFHFQPIPQFYQ